MKNGFFADLLKAMSRSRFRTEILIGKNKSVNGFALCSATEDTHFPVPRKLFLGRSVYVMRSMLTNWYGSSYADLSS